MSRIGLLGGTFDPIHRGHLRMASAAQRALDLQRIYFVPANGPWHKRDVGAGYIDRYAMVALALAGRSQWVPLHIPLEPPTYSVDQVRWLQRLFPRDRIYFILGADAFAEIDTWKDYRELLGLCDFVLLARAGYALDEILAELPEGIVQPATGNTYRLPNRGSLHWIGTFKYPASSTQIRKEFRNNSIYERSITLPPTVGQYARRARLYANYGKKVG